jgi:hypothetical protein
VDTPGTNIDMLAWFSEDERQECSKCGERAVVTLPDALASFCLACGVIWIEGEPIEVAAGVRAPAQVLPRRGIAGRMPPILRALRERAQRRRTRPTK